MATTTKKEIIDQIHRLRANLKVYKKAQANPPSWMDSNALADAVTQIEAEISLLEIKLEVMVALGIFYPYNSIKKVA